MSGDTVFSAGLEAALRAARYHGYLRGVVDCLRTLREKGGPLEIQNQLFEVLNAADEDVANRELQK